MYQTRVMTSLLFINNAFGALFNKGPYYILILEGTWN